jgi:hypothetical protein
MDENYDTRLYVNNTLQSDTGDSTSLFDSDWDFTVRASNAQDPVDGLIDDVRIYNRVLTEDEISRLY